MRKNNKKGNRRIKAVITAMAIFTIIGSLFLEYVMFFDTLIPGIKMGVLNYDITCEIDDAQKWAGYIDNTGFNDRVQKLLDERQKTWYENPNDVIRTFANSNPIIKTLWFLGAIIVIPGIPVVWVNFLKLLGILPIRKKKKT